MTDSVLITGARAAAALDLARDFVAAGWQVHLADCNSAFMARWSTAPYSVHRYPSPVEDRLGFRRKITTLIEQVEPALVIPCCEEIFHLSAPALASLFGNRLFAPPLPILRNLHDKLAFSEACLELHLPVPEIQRLDTEFDLAYAANDHRNWVFKPRFSRFGELTLVGPSKSQLSFIADIDRSHWFAQRRIYGMEASFYAIAQEGILLAFSAYRSDWRLPGGASFAFEAVEKCQADKLTNLAAVIAKHFHISGQFSCDVIFDADKIPWLIECNPRATSGIHLLSGEGHLAHAMANRIAIPHGKTQNPTYLGPAMILFGLPLALRSRKFGHWLQTFFCGRDIISRPGDRLPLVGALADAASFAAKGVRQGISTIAATTSDIEWNGEELS